MEITKQIFLIIGIAESVITFAAAKKYSSYSDDGYAQPKKLPVILMHKQALQEDGGFNFAFAGDNGIKQGETIHPDGNRIGAYSYVDPNGETISVKYSAGKDGFKILEGDHLPRAPLVPAASSNSKYSHPLPMFATSDESEEVAYGPTGSYSHHRSKVNPYHNPLYKVHEDGSSAETYSQSAPYSRAARYEPEEDSRRPHTFGKGYSFEFGSGASN